MDVRPLDDQEALDRLIHRQPLNPFLQTWAWGQFQSAYGRRIWRLGAWEAGELAGAALVIEHQLVLGKTYLYCPRGPVATTAVVFGELLQAIKKLGLETGAMYVKADPGKYVFAVNPEEVSGFTPGSTLQPRQTLLIDTAKPLPELLAAMHQKTRYNIRLAEKRGVTVRWSIEDEDFRHFLILIRATYGRQGIRLHPDQYYQTLFSTLRSARMCELAVAEHHGTVLAANLVIWHGLTATYLHGGSAETRKDLMAPHLLQWRTIEQAHQRGGTNYDFWGIAPENQPQHKWSGVTRFKKGFGGHVEVFPTALNAVLQPSWYTAYRLAKRMRGGVDE